MTALFLYEKAGERHLVQEIICTMGGWAHEMYLPPQLHYRIQ